MAGPKIPAAQVNVPEQDQDLFDAFQQGITESSTDIPDYFYDVLEEDFADLLA